MCSSPKGSVKKSRLPAKGSFGEMDYSDYAAMVQRSNASYERRQDELAALRDQRVSESPVIAQNESSEDTLESSAVLTPFQRVIDWLNQPFQFPQR